MTSALIVLDWGTTSLRAWLLDADGATLESRAEPWGIMHVPNGDFAAAYASITDGWQSAELNALASGMIGSANGGTVAPYRAVAAGGHSKWVYVREERVEDFTTHMSGELFADIHMIAIEINEEFVIKAATEGHRWRNPVWRHHHGSFAEVVVLERCERRAGAKPRSRCVALLRTLNFTTTRYTIAFARG